MLRSIRNLNLGLRAAIYTLVMGLLVLVIAGLSPSLSKSLLLPWLICYGAGLASMVIVEPFRHPKGSPYGFQLGSAARTTPPLLLVIVMFLTRQPMDQLFWSSLLFSYFVMLVMVILLTLPPNPRSDLTKAEEKSQKNRSD